MILTNNQNEFMQSALYGDNIYLSGKAGVGKSTVVKILIKELKKLNKRVAVIAPTGIAANNVGGQTMHSMFGINPFGVITFEECNYLSQEKRRMLTAIDVLIIDEVSMLRPDHLDAIHWTLLKNGCGRITDKQLILVGDFKQLPTVLKDTTRAMLMRIYEGDDMFSAMVYPSLNMKVIELNEVVRQTDTEFIHALNLTRDGIKSDYWRQFVGDKPNDGVVLAPHNSTVYEYNDRGLARLNTDKFTFIAQIKGNLKADDFKLESKIEVKQGAKIMYLANSKTAPLHNGTLGLFASYKGNHYIQVDGIDYPLAPIEFTKKEYVLNDEGTDLELKEVGSIKQFPFRLAYALSIHKSQGMTFDKVTVDLTRPCFSKGMLYVALSRVTSPSGLRILTGGRV